MTLYGLIVAGGVVLSLGLLAVLVSLSPVRRTQPPLCLRTRVDESCPQECLRTCPLVPHRRTPRVGHRVRHAHGGA
jgi:hypothetical protein